MNMDMVQLDDKKVREIQKSMQEILRSLLVAVAKRSHGLIEREEACRKAASTISIMERIDRLREYIRALFDATLELANMMSNMMFVNKYEAITSIVIPHCEQIRDTYESIRNDMQCLLEVDNAKFEKLFKKIDLVCKLESLNDLNILSSVLLNMIFQLDDMKAYLKRIILQCTILSALL